MKAKISFVVLATAVLLSACETENYTSGDGKYSYLRADFGEAYTNYDSLISKVITDDGNNVVLASPYKASSYKLKSDTTYRCMFYYKAFDDGTIEPYAFATVPVMRLHQKISPDSTKYDPMDLESAWMAKSGKYLNVSLLLKTGTEDGNKNVQAIALMTDTIIPNSSGKNTLHLVFLHWQNNVPEYYTARQYVSISCDTLRKYISTGDSINLKVYTGKTTFTEKKFVFQ